MTKFYLFAALLVCVVCNRVEAQDQPPAKPPAIEWTESTRTALAQCLVSEAGWRTRTEHAAISYVLKRRWHRAYRRNPRVTFEQIVRRYCAVHRHVDVRRPWLKELEWAPMTEDPGFDATVVWTNYVDAWEYVRSTVELFEKDALPDPLPLARHWGGRMDGVPIGGVLLPRSVRLPGQPPVELRNLFYAIDDALVQRVRAARREFRQRGTTGTVPARLASGLQS